MILKHQIYLEHNDLFMKNIICFWVRGHLSSKTSQINCVFFPYDWISRKSFFLGSDAMFQLGNPLLINWNYKDILS